MAWRAGKKLARLLRVQLGLKPVARKEIKQREASILELRRWAATGKLTVEKAEELEAEKRAEIAELSSDEPPEIDPDAMAAFAAWGVFGEPCTMMQGLAAAVVDERARLFQPRLSLLQANEVPRESQEIYFYIWMELDATLLDIRRMQLDEAMSGK